MILRLCSHDGPKHIVELEHGNMHWQAEDSVVAPHERSNKKLATALRKQQKHDSTQPMSVHRAYSDQVKA